jgi:hypothetical protein
MSTPLVFMNFEISLCSIKISNALGSLRSVLIVKLWFHGAKNQISQVSVIGKITINCIFYSGGNKISPFEFIYFPIVLRC